MSADKCRHGVERSTICKDCDDEAAEGRRTHSLQRPCSVEMTSRQVIEHKLLTALDDSNTVAALFSKQDLECIIAALYGHELGDRKGKVLSWEAHMKRRKELADSMSQLLREAFPPNKDYTTPVR